MAKQSKRMADASKAIDRKKHYALNDAIKLVSDNAKCKFDETVDIAMNLGVDPKHSDQMVRGSVNMPNGLGKNVRVAVFAKGDKAEAAQAAGADIVGAEDLMEMIQKGEMNFDRCIATPDMMGLVGRVGKLLGPRGLMPNPKLGTVTPDVEKAVKDAKSGAVEFRVEKAGIIHAGVGKSGFAVDKLAGNIMALVTAVLKARPSGAKGQYMKTVTISSTHGPAVKLDVAELEAAGA